MILLHLVVCALTLVKVFANDFHQQVDFFNGFEGVKRRLDTYTAKQFSEDSFLEDDDEKQWIVQKLDHFDSSNNKTWRQVDFNMNILKIGRTHMEGKHANTLFYKSKIE